MKLVYPRDNTARCNADWVVVRSITDLPHDMDFPYVIRIIDDLRVIRPYHILIRICLKYTENPYTAHTNDNRRFIIHLPMTATEKHTLLAEPGGICIVRQMAQVYFGNGQ